MGNTFNPAQFVDMEIDKEMVKRPPLPEGDYTAMIGEVNAAPWTSQKDSSKSGIRYVVPLKIQVPPDVKASLGIDTDTIQLTDSIMLDLNENGGIDTSPGKNNGLRRYREALGMNKPGEPFSARRMQGQPLLVKIKHEIYEGEVQERIGGVAKVG
jgi:hypothetical protein